MGSLSSKQWEDRGKIQQEFHNEQCESIFHVGDNTTNMKLCFVDFFKILKMFKIDILKNQNTVKNENKLENSKN